MPFLLLNSLDGVGCGGVGVYVVLSIVFWTVCLWVLARGCVGRLWVFWWVLVVLLLFRICSCFVVGGTSYCLCQAVVGLMLLGLLALPPDVWMTWLVFQKKVLVLGRWWAGCVLLGFG